jgi:signal transduction histidine kinase
MIGRPSHRISIRRDLGLQLLALYLLFVGPIALAGVLFDAVSRQRLEADVRAADLALARAIALESNDALSRAIHTVEQLALTSAVRQADSTGMESLFANVALARPEVNLIYLLDAQGIMLFHYPIEPGSTVGVDFSFREYFQQALQSEHAVVSRGRVSPTTGQPVATTVMPIRDAQGDFLGVVATNLKLESLSETMAAIAADFEPSGFRVSILDAAGQVIADPDPRALLQPLSPGLDDDLLGGPSTSSIGVDQQGDEWLLTYVPIPSAGWGVVVQRPAAAAFASVRAFHQGMLLALAAFLGGGLLFWLILNRQLIRPLARLTGFSQAIGVSPEELVSRRNALTPLTRRRDQMGQLSRSLVHMEEVIERRLAELSTLLETGKAVVSTLDSQAVLDIIVDQTIRLTRADRCAIVALDPASRAFRIQASRGLSQAYTDRLRIDPAEPNSPSMRAIRTGQPIQVTDTEEDPTYVELRPRSRAEGYRALLAVPLTAQHAPPAALLVYYGEPHAFTEREVELVWSFANHAAMAIENAALFAHSDVRLQEQTRRLEALMESLADGLILEDLDGKVLFCNRQLCSLVELGPEAARQLPASGLRSRLLRGAEKPAEATARLEQAVRLPESQTLEWTVERSEGESSLRFHTFAVTDARGLAIGHGLLVQDRTRDRELDRMKDSLIATVSHELRTPLAAIKGYASTLLADDVRWDAPSQREFLTIISQETDRLSSLVSDLLDLSRIEAGTLRLARQPCLLSDLVQQAIQRARPAPEGGVRLEVDSALPPLHVDRRQIEAVLRNLIENAAKYAGSACSVTITAAAEDGLVVVRVIDDGPGIPEHSSARVFEPFVRLDLPLTRQTPGAGLGLSICRGFVRAHGGEIWLEKTIRGTSVAVSLPLEEPSLA